MNCKQANSNICIREVMDSFSLTPQKQNTRSAVYFALDREERTPSFFVDYVRNTAYDFGSGKRYDNVSIIQAVKRCSVSEALEYLRNLNTSFPRQNYLFPKTKAEQRSYSILEKKKLQSPALLNYLKSRKLHSQVEHLVEIHYEVKGKDYYGIGFQNDSGGFEVRNQYGKICLGKKDITTIKNSSKTVKIFEGFTDYLSYRILEKSFDENPSDYIILNSVPLVYRMKKVLGDYTKVELYLDNDKAGDEATAKLNTFHSNVEDCRLLYKNYNDLNDFINRKGPLQNP